MMSSILVKCKSAEEQMVAVADDGQLSSLEAEAIGLFIQLGRLVSQPRSFAEIYGLLFVSPRPLSAEVLVERLGTSRASAERALLFLRRAGLLRMVYVPGDRRMHYEAVAEPRHMVVGSRVRLVQEPASAWGGFRRSPALWSQARGAAMDLIHSHGLWTDVSHLAGDLARRRGVPHLLAPCGMLAPGALRHHGWKKVPIRVWFQGRALREAQCLHAKSHKEYEGIRQFGLRNPVAVIPNLIVRPVDSNQWSVISDLGAEVGGQKSEVRSQSSGARFQYFSFQRFRFSRVVGSPAAPDGLVPGAAAPGEGGGAVGRGVGGNPN